MTAPQKTAAYITVSTDQQIPDPVELLRTIKMKLYADLSGKLSEQYGAGVMIIPKATKHAAINSDGLELGDVTFDFGYHGDDFVNNNVTLRVVFTPRP